MQDTRSEIIDTGDSVESKAIALVEPHELEERSVDEVMAQVHKIQQLMRSALKEGEHYGVVPGTSSKPTLLKPGAEKLCFMFRLSPKFDIDERQLEDGHREYKVVCDLYHLSGSWVSQGVGICSTMESKYRWRKAERECPECNAAAIYRSKFDDKGWYCYGKVGGCNAKFAADDQRITGQETGRKENPDIADVYNTAIKMAKKRAHVDATITATAAGDLFTQDLEDTGPTTRRTEEPKAEPPKNGKTITKAQAKMLWAKAWTRAQQIGPEQGEDALFKDIQTDMMRGMLQRFGLEHTEELMRDDIDQAIKLIETFGEDEISEEGDF